MSAKKPGFGEIGDMNELVALYVDTVQAWIDALPQHRDESEPTPGSNREIMLLLARAQAAWLTSGLRYGQQVSALMADRGMDLAGLTSLVREPPADATPDETRRQIELIDKARDFLTQVADASLTEAETLRIQLLKIERELRALQAGGSDPDPKRNVRTKR
jgi:hypothetical protein